MNTASLHSPDTSTAPIASVLSTKRANPWFVSLTVVGFAVVASFVTARHEMSGDELQHWGIAVESQTVLDVFDNLRYESSPALWHLLLYPITRWTHNPVWMQVLHVTLATATALIFLIWAPFTNLQKLLFVFGYFSIFEYAVISRHYVLGALFLFAFLALFPWGGKRAIWAAVMIFLQSQTSFFGFVLAFACTATLIVHYWLQRPSGAQWLTRNNWCVLSIALVGLVTSFLQLLQHPDSSIHVAWDFVNPWRFIQASTIPWRSLIPIPSSPIDFWNTNFLDSFESLSRARELPSLLLQGLLSAIIVLGSAFWFRNRPESLALFLTTTLGCLAFFYLKKLGFLRHHGHLYLAWIGGVWLLWSPRFPETQDDAIRHAEKASRGWPARVVTIVLATHVIAACIALNAEARHVFSPAKAMAEWIRNRGHENDLLIAPVAIAGHLDRDVYRVPNARFGRFEYYRHPWLQLTNRELVELARSLQMKAGKRCLLVLDSGQYDLETEDVGASKVAGFDGRILSKSINAYVLTPN